MKKYRLKSLGTLTVLALVSFAAAQSGAANAQTQRQQQRQASAPADVKVRSKMSSGAGPGMETITYIKGARMRSEMGNAEMASAGMAMANITQCDLKRTISLNDKARTYMITPLDASGDGAAGGGAAPGGAPAGAQPPTERRRGGVVNITSTLTDTGERKEMFGFTARRIKSSMVREASPDACDPNGSRIETDGWYIDFQYDFSCPGQKPVAYTPGVITRPDCEDEVRMRTIGTAKLGYPLQVTTTMHQKDGRTVTMTQEVLELSRAPLDAALFDVPAGYTLAQNMQELYGMGGMAAGRGARDTDAAAAADNPATSAAATTGAPAVVAATTPKKAGAVRICQVMPKAQVTSGNTAQAAEAVRNTFSSYLTGPSLEVASLNARLPAQAMEEARQSQCDYVLHSSMTQKKGGGGGMFGRALGNVAGAAVGHIPGGSTAGEAAARSAVVTGVYTTASIASNVKAKDELALEYKLEAVEGARTVASKTEKAKAKSDGEDVLTPLVERASAAIVAAVTRQ